MTPVAAAAGPAPLRVAVTPAVADRPDDIRRVAAAAAAAGLAAFAASHDVTVVGVALGPATARGVASTPDRIGIALGVPDEGGGLLLHRYEVDLVAPDVKPHLEIVLRLPAVLVGHDLPPILLELWRHGLPDPVRVWDTRVAAATYCLGVHHPGYRDRVGGTASAIVGREAAAAERDRATGRPATAARYGVPVAASGPADVAASAAGIYLGQVAEAATRDVLDHLVRVEMPWVITTARMSHSGVRVDPGRAGAVARTADSHLHSLLSQLAAYHVFGTSDADLEAFFARAGLLDHFRRGGGCTFDGGRLDAVIGLHPAVPLIRAARRIHTLRSAKVLTGEFVGAGGRVHPRYQVLGAHTGRLTCDSPNLPGIGRLFRPLVVPEPGCGIGEADWAQIEVGVAAAVFGDHRLVTAFNAGDVYATTAQAVFAGELPPDAAGLSPADFREQYSDWRDRAKIGVLGLLYGMGAAGLRLRLGPQAAMFATGFEQAYPILYAGLAASRAAGAQRGCVATPFGLRRYRAAEGAASTWESNWFANFPVQATAAMLFKQAGNRLDRLYPPLGARLILPLHDAFMFESPLGRLSEVADATRRVMEDSVGEAFPELRPRVAVNIRDPGCWNKDGHADSLDRWTADPLFTL
ncbi:MAG TPA: DNA polymerase [Urbifossiella sp.]|nr:DNA polymerase [Urbifossiella sp.]